MRCLLSRDVRALRLAVALLVALFAASAGAFTKKQDKLIALQTRASRRGGLITTVSKTFRLMMQSLMLGLGAISTTF